MHKLNQLIKEARASATFRGHQLFRFTHYKGSDHLASAVCKNCSAYVGVNSKPQPNEIEIGGEAVAVNCKETARNP